MPTFHIYKDGAKVCTVLNLKAQNYRAYLSVYTVANKWRQNLYFLYWYNLNTFVRPYVHCFYFLKSLMARCLGFQGCHMVIRKNWVWIYFYITPTPHPPLLQNINLFMYLRCKMRSWFIMVPVYLSSVIVFKELQSFFLFFRSGKLLEQMKRQFGTRFKKINNLT